MTTTISPSIFIKEEISIEVKNLINQKTGLSVRNGIEIILKNDLNNNNSSSLNGNNEINLNSIDVGDILREGLLFLALCPFDTLDIPLNADINQIRKAYKKMALKYHPDKNPVTTPLFQAIHSAYEKLTNESMRNEYQTPDPPPPTSSKPPEGSPPKKDFHENKNPSNTTESEQSSNNNNNNNNTQKSNDPRKNKAREKEKEDMKAFAESQQRAKMKERMRQEERKKKEEQKVETDEEKIQREREAGRKKEMEEAEIRAAERRAKTGYGSRQTYYQSENVQRKERSSNGEEYPHQNPHPNNSNNNNSTSASAGTGTSPKSNSQTNVPIIPIPIGLTGIIVDIGTIQLQWTPLSQWNPPPEIITKYNIELSWREVLIANPSGFGQIEKVDAEWEIGSLMITGDKVMKRNLTPGSTYEFSIRYRTPASIDKKQQGTSVNYFYY